MGNRAQVLIPGSAEYVTLNGKMDFTDVIKGHIWRWENYSDPPSGSHRIARALKIGRGSKGVSQRDGSVEGPDVRTGSQDGKVASRR